MNSIYIYLNSIYWQMNSESGFPYSIFWYLDSMPRCLYSKDGLLHSNAVVVLALSVNGLFHGFTDTNGFGHLSVQIRESAIESVDEWAGINFFSI